MKMVQKKRNEKKFGVMLLIGLCVYAFLTISLVNMGNVSVEHSEIKAQTDLVGMTNTFEYREISELEIEEDIELLNYDDEGEVEGILDSTREFFWGTCNADYGIEEPQLFCSDGSVKSISNVKIARITAPDILFLGAANPFDNLVLTSNPVGGTAFRNASEMINPDFDYSINMPPNHPDYQLLDSVILSKEEKEEAFDMHYEAGDELSEIPFDVHPKEYSNCPLVVNGGEFNVKGSNELQKELTDSKTPPGIMALGDRNVPANICREDVRTIHLDEEESFVLCQEGLWQTIVGAIRGVFTMPKRQCSEFEGVIIDAPLGSGEICNETDCSVRYSEAGRLLTSPPTWAEELYPDVDKDAKENDYLVDDPVILTTPCYVRLGSEPCWTRCIWDISMWQNIFQLEQIFTYPDYKGTMTEDLYWQNVENEIKIRARVGIRNY